MSQKFVDVFNIGAAFKITNWCNLCCAHCCECSGPKNPLNLMPLDKMEKYINELSTLPMGMLLETITISGGEGMAPYLFGQSDYIPTALKLIFDTGKIPTIKTNGLWAKNDDMRTSVLDSVSKAASDAHGVVAMDISVDEFHDNILPVANLVSGLLSKDYYKFTILPGLSGFSTKASAYALEQLKNELEKRGLSVVDCENDTEWVVCDEKSCNITVIRKVYDAQIFRWGRAIDNNVWTYNPDGVDLSLASIQCLQIDNDDNATLNNKFTSKIEERKLLDVLLELSFKQMDAYFRYKGLNK